MRYFFWTCNKGDQIMLALRDLLSRRDELVHGVIEIHDKKGGTVRKEILWIKDSEQEVEFTVGKTLIAKGCEWEISAEPHARDTICYKADLKITEGTRPQFDLPSGWVIIYPNTDSVSKKM